MIRYARISIRDQDAATQRKALLSAGCEVFFDDTISGSTQSRSGPDKAMAVLAPGEELVVWKLDRLGPSMQLVVNTVVDLDRRGIRFRSLTKAIDFTSSTRKLPISVFGWLAEVERDLTTERTKAGLAAAKKRGVRLGRKRKLTGNDVAHTARLIESGEESVAGMAKIFEGWTQHLGSGT